MQRQIEPGYANQIQRWQMVFCAENTAQRNTNGREFFKAPKVCLGGPGLAGTIGETNGGTSAVAHCDEPCVLLARKPAEANTAIRLPLEQAAQTAEHIRNGGVRIT